MAATECTRTGARSRTALALAASFAMVLCSAGPGLAQTATSPEQAAAEAAGAWAELKPDLFGDKELIEGTDTVAIDAPKRATDPAVVPVTLSFDPKMDVRKVTLVIDENPSPVAATFEFA